MAEQRRLCILVVEDHGDTLAVMTHLLRQRRYDVRAASTYRQAEGLAAGGGCDLLVSDLGLPDRSGLDLMRDLKAKFGLKGIAVTGHAYESDVQAATDAGFARVITKPCDINQLVRAIEEVTGSSSTAPYR